MMARAKEERKKRWEVCQEYLLANRDLPAAILAARLDDVVFDTAVWITALGKLLESGKRPGGRKL